MSACGTTCFASTTTWRRGSRLPASSPMSRVITGLYAQIAATPLIWLVILAPIGLVMLMSFGVQRMQASTLQLVFWVYAGVMGLSLATVFLVFTGDERRAGVLHHCRHLRGDEPLRLHDAARPVAVRLVPVHGPDRHHHRQLVNMFLASSALQFAISVIGVIVFTGLTAWDTQQIKEIILRPTMTRSGSKKAIMGALRLYLDFINLFMMLMQLIGTRRD